MKPCKRCFETFDENEHIDPNPATALGDLFTDTGDADIEDLCPACREELGIINLLGFKN